MSQFFGRNPAGREGRFRLAGWLLAVVASMVVLMAVYRLLPGSLPDIGAYTSEAAYAQCLTNARDVGPLTCMNFGFPSGAPRPFGLPVPLGARLLFGHTGAITLGEIKFVYGMYLLLAYSLALVFFARMSKSRWLGLLGAFLYVVSPIVSAQATYGALMVGMALMPGYFLIDRQLEKGFESWRADRLLAIAIAVVGLRVFALFLDGYTFTMSSMLALVFYGFGLLRRETAASSFKALLVYAAGCVTAYLCYRQYIHVGKYPTMPIDLFRAAGVDTATLIFPVHGLQWFYDLLDVGLHVTPDMLYGDMSSLLGIFAGYASLVALGIVGWGVWRWQFRANRVLVAVLATGLIGLLLSLGPSLKFNDFREPVAAQQAHSLHFSDYMMPKEAAPIDLHTGWIYLHVPGISNIRALARWEILTRMAWVVLLLAAIMLLRRRRLPAVGWLLAGLALVETVPNPARAMALGRAQYVAAYDLYYGYGTLFSEKLAPGERVLLLQLHDGANYNEFLADPLCARANVYCYNAAGDKTLELIEGHWPREILEIRRGHAVVDNLAAAFRKHLIDVVVVPHFDLRTVDYSPVQAHLPAVGVDQRIAQLATALGASAEGNAEFTFLRPKQADTAGTAAAPCGIECWQSWPSQGNTLGLKWGPSQGKHGSHFNPQPGGWSALWVGVNDPDARYTIAFGNALVPTVSGPNIVVGRMPASVETDMVIGASYRVALVDRIGHTVTDLGRFTLTR